LATLNVCFSWQQCTPWPSVQPVKQNFRSERSLRRYSTIPSRHAAQRDRSLVVMSEYGRGAEIWPECNDDTVFTLEESFANGQVPDLKPLLKEKKTLKRNKNDWRRIPMAIVSASLLLGGLVKPIDLLCAVFLSGYFFLLHCISQSSLFQQQESSTFERPIMPSIPLEGHVPALVLKPLGHSLTKSIFYRQWLQWGMILGMYGPILTLLRLLPARKWIQAKACARPLFLLCCQALCEQTSKQKMTPLPINILIPIAFNALRLGSIWDWVRTPLGWFGRVLAISNLAYWGSNLFGFLLPIASLRYLRAHFYCVEAEEVKLRPGFDKVSVGLMSS